MIIRLLLLLLLLTMHHQAFASEFAWMEKNVTDLGSEFDTCLTMPSSGGFNTGSISLDLENTGQWQSTGAYVTKDKALNFSWNTLGSSLRNDKYKVLFRIDGRFSKPQIFIQKYDYDQAKYVADFTEAHSGKFIDYQSNHEMDIPTRVARFNDYFNFIGRDKIKVKAGDVISLNLEQPANFFTSGSDMSNDYSFSLIRPSLIYTDSSGLNNKMIYSTSSVWCNALTAQNPSTSNCLSGGIYQNQLSPYSSLVGIANDIDFLAVRDSLPICAEGSNGPNNSPLCAYDRGRGMQIRLGSTSIKNTSDSFVAFSSQDILYHKADTDGELEFDTDWPIENIFTGGTLNQLMANWTSIADYTPELEGYLSANSDITKNQFMHLGRYTMHIEVGNGNGQISNSDLSNIKVEYTIKESGTPDGSDSSTQVDYTERSSANEDGYLWVRVINPSDNVSGNINVLYSNYTGNTWFSDIIYGKVISPIRDNINNLSRIIFEKLISNVGVQRIINSMLVLFVIIYSLAFLGGYVELSATDLLYRILKISFVVALFSPASWDFFNNYLFRLFLEGADQLFVSVLGNRSNNNNIFGFIDPVIQTYINPDLWKVLGVQLLQLHTSLWMFSLILIVGILIYLRGLLEVIIGYCLAFIGIAVLVSLAPFFISFILFERTKHLFDNWISLLISYTIKPTILLLFFLLVDEVFGVFIYEAVMPACWGTLVEFKLHLNFGDFLNLGEVSFDFFPGVPFYITTYEGSSDVAELFTSPHSLLKVASISLAYLIIAKVSLSLVEYVDLVSEMITNVSPARQYGEVNHSNNPTANIANKLTMGAGKAAERYIKNPGKLVSDPAKAIRHPMQTAKKAAGAVVSGVLAVKDKKDYIMGNDDRKDENYEDNKPDGKEDKDEKGEDKK